MWLVSHQLASLSLGFFLVTQFDFIDLRAKVSYYFLLVVLQSKSVTTLLTGKIASHYTAMARLFLNAECAEVLKALHLFNLYNNNYTTFESVV